MLYGVRLPHVWHFTHGQACNSNYFLPTYSKIKVFCNLPISWFENNNLCFSCISRFRLFARIHWITNFRSLLMCLLSFFNEFSVSKRLVSSAKWCTVEKSTALWKSLIKRIKRIGSNIDPWGTPILISLSEDLVLLIVVCCFLPSRNDLSHLFDLSRIP